MITRWPRAHPYGFLFFTLLATLVAAPLLSGWHLGSAIFELFLAVNLLAALFGIERIHGRRFLVAATVILFTARLIRNVLPTHLFELIALLCIAGIAIGAAVLAARFAFRARRVDSEHIFAALSAYLLAGIFLGLAHISLESIRPGSYAASGAPGISDLPSAIYFSFVTLATLGYGDVVPATPLARGLAVFEAVTGQLYLAVLVARLVSLYTRDTEGR